MKNINKKTIAIATGLKMLIIFAVVLQFFQTARASELNKWLKMVLSLFLLV